MLDRIMTVAALLCLASVGASYAAEAPDPGCGAFALTGGEKGVEVVDNPPEGKSSGDVRAGWRKLVDDGGRAIGEVHFVATLTAPGGSGRGDVLTSQYFVTLPGGWIVSSSLYELPDAGDTSQRASDAVLVVTGGTGAFAGAGGTITIEAGDPPTYVFDLACD